MRVSLCPSSSYFQLVYVCAVCEQWYVEDAEGDSEERGSERTVERMGPQLPASRPRVSRR